MHVPKIYCQLKKQGSWNSLFLGGSSNANIYIHIYIYMYFQAILLEKCIVWVGCIMTHLMISEPAIWRKKKQLLDRVAAGIYRWTRLIFGYKTENCSTKVIIDFCSIHFFRNMPSLTCKKICWWLIHGVLNETWFFEDFIVALFCTCGIVLIVSISFHLILKVDGRATPKGWRFACKGPWFSPRLMGETRAISRSFPGP